MSAPPPTVYFAPDFDPTTLRVPQLRSILLEYQVPFQSATKKADLIDLFEDHVRPRARDALAASSRVQASSRGITVMSETGSEVGVTAPSTSGTKRRGRPRRTTTQEPDLEESGPQGDIEVIPEPPTKKPRGRPKKSTASVASAPVSASVTPTRHIPVEPLEDPAIEMGELASDEDDEVHVTVVKSPAKKVGRPRKSAKTQVEVPQVEEPDQGTEAEVEDEENVTPARQAHRARASVNTASPKSDPSLSVPSSSNRPKSGRVTSASVASDVNQNEAQPEPPTPKFVSKKRSNASIIINKMTDVKEEIESEPEERQSVPRSAKKTPKREKDDGAFSDYNPFQSGNEEPAERERRRRKSSMGLVKTRPAQPRFSEPPPPPSVYQPTNTAPATPGILRRVGPSRENLRTPPSATRDELRHEKELAAAQQHNHVVSDKLNEITSSDRYDSRICPQIESQNERSLVRNVQDNIPSALNPKSAVPLSVLLLLLLSLLGNFKSQSASLGYCDSASNTNNIALTRQNAFDNAKACVARRASIDKHDREAAKRIECDVSALPLIPAPRPTSCAPCPAHAVCDNGQLLSCEPEYIYSGHPLSFLSGLTDGMPGFGPRSFPPTCRPDTAKKRMVGGLAKEMEKELAQGRGLIVCAGRGEPDGRKGEGERFGVQETTLRESFSGRRDPKFTQEQFDEIFEAALNDLVEHQDVIESIDINGISWYAAARTELTMACKAKLQMMDMLSRWKSQLGSALAVLAMIGWIQSTMKSRKQDKYRAEELVQVALKRLQDQERLHYSDPASNPSPFIPLPQLRDLVLPPTGSSTYRNRLWNKVNDLIEANANVAVREQEVRGELWKTWEWQGVGERHVTWND